MSKFDDNYDYDKYREDHRQLQDNSSKTGFDLDLMGAGELFGATAISGAISASYGLISAAASGSHASSHGVKGEGKLGFGYDRKSKKLSEDEFNRMKNKVMQQKHALEHSNTRSSLDKHELEQVAKTVD